MEDRVSFVLPTFERRDHLARALDWYAAAGLHVVVADGSESANDEAAAREGVTYFHRPDLDPHERIRESLPLTATPYVVFCADDDLIVPAAVRDCVTFLDRHDDHAAAQGRYVTFTESAGEVAYKPAYALSTTQTPNADDAASRIEQVFDPYHQWSYAVHRRVNLVHVYEHLVPEFGLVNSNLIELLVAMVAATNGRTRILPRFYCAREMTPGSSGTVTKTLPDIVNDPSSAGDLEAFLLAGITHLMRRAECDEATAKSAVSRCLNAYLERFLPALQRSYDRSDDATLEAVRRLGGFPLFACDSELDAVSNAIATWAVVRRGLERPTSSSSTSS